MSPLSPIKEEVSSAIDQSKLTFKSEDQVENFIKLHNISTLCATDGSALVGRGAAYTIEDKKLNKEYEGGLRLSNAASAQLCETKGMNICLARLVDLKNKGELNGECLIISDSAYVVNGINNHLEYWASHDYKKKMV
uniref:RNase H type-1 domain-containing protein n=1 Tax=Strongyloides papillosus TaxID=174720 RepID=A0A0N5C283_STREA